MATYRPSFVDVSGLTSGVSRGLEVAAQLKKQQDALAEAKTDDFLKTYQPGKLRQMDIPDFTNSYTNYKQSALNYSRLNRGGAKPEELAIAKANMDKSLGEMNSIYSKSATAAEKQAEYAEYLKTARIKGYDVPAEVSAFTNVLSSTPISKIDVGVIPSAYTFDLVPKEIDWSELGKKLDNAGAKIKDITTVRRKVPVRTGIDGKVIEGDAVTTYMGRSANTAVDILGKVAMTDARLANSAKADYDLLVDGISKGSPASIARFNEIKEYFPNINKIEDVTPIMVFGLPLYRREEQKTVIDDKAANYEYERGKDLTTIGLQRQRVAKMGTGRSGSEKVGTEAVGHPSNIVSGIVSSASGTTIPYPATKELQRYSLPSPFGGKEIIENATYNPDSGTFLVETLSRKGPTALRIAPEALISQLVEASGEYKVLTQPKNTPSQPKTSGGKIKVNWVK